MRQAFEEALSEDPRQAPIIRGTNGARKIRWALPGRGISGGVRVIYYYREEKQRVYLLLVYAKSDREDITDAEKADIRRVIATLKAEE